MITAAKEKECAIDSFADLAQIYADEVIGGRTSRALDADITSAATTSDIRTQLIRTLGDALADPTQAISTRTVAVRCGITPPEADKVVNALHYCEIVRAENGYFRLQNDPWVTSFIKGRYSLEQEGATRASVIWTAISDFMAVAPRRMESLYRERSSIGLRDLMARFDGQEIPRGLIDYKAFKSVAKGLDRDEAERAASDDSIGTIRLPSITYTAYTSAFYPQVETVADRDRSAVALGFHSDSENRGRPLVWIAAEIDSKMEASKDRAEFWCDRLEMVAVTCGFEDHRIWLVSPEGFDDEAMEVLGRRNAFGSSRIQAEMLRSRLTEELPEKALLEEYEITLPMTGDAEIVAANTLEDVPRRHGFDTSTVNKIKTALVEACINATEHSHSPDGKIYQKIGVSEDRIVVTVANRGVRLNGTLPKTGSEDSQRRGWGLKLMQKLMDEVTIEGTDDGTVITMTKLRPTE